MNTQLEVKSEQINSLPLLLEIIRVMGIKEKIDSIVRVHGHWEGASVGTIVSIWLSYMLIERDHRLVYLREWANERAETINQMLGIKLRDTDCSDDRLANILTMLGKEESQAQLDEEMTKSWVRVYQLPTETVRLDSTSVSVYHEAEAADSLMQFGYSKDHRPDLKQYKVMMATIDPLGMPLICQMVAGNSSDEKLYIPAYDAVKKSLGHQPTLVVGDSKMGALETRGYMVASGSHYLCAYRPPSATKTINEWIAQAQDNTDKWQYIKVVDEQTQQEKVKTAIYQLTRTQEWVDSNNKLHQWTERVLMVWSSVYAASLGSRREELRDRVIGDLEKLRLEPKRGRKRYTNEAELAAVANELIARAHLEGIINYTLSLVTPAAKPYWIVDRIWVDSPSWQQLMERLGWQVYVSSLPTTAEYSAVNLVKAYNQQAIEERGFSRLKTRNLQIRPVFLRDETRISGLLWLLSLALKIITLTEYRLRTALQQRDDEVAGLNPACRSQSTKLPTTERVIAAFSNITLSIISGPAIFQRHVPNLNPTQQHILLLLGISLNLYQALAEGATNLLPHLRE